MRLLAVLFAALTLNGPPAGAVAPPGGPSCPPLTREQAIRAAEFALRPEPGMIDAISTDAFRPYCRPGPRAKQPFLCTGGGGRKLTLAEVTAVDAAYRTQFTYRADYIEYGDEDRWRAGVVCGDCEDYSLTLAGKLHAAGGGGQFLRLMLWGYPTGGGHATLLVETADAGVIEVGNGPAATQGPQPYNPARGKRFATIRFDGKRKLEPTPGYKVTMFDRSVEPAQ